MLVWHQIGKAFVFQRSVQDMAYDCGFFYTVQKTLREAYAESPAQVSRIFFFVCSYLAIVLTFEGLMI